MSCWNFVGSASCSLSGLNSSAEAIGFFIASWPPAISTVAPTSSPSRGAGGRAGGAAGGGGGGGGAGRGGDLVEGAERTAAGRLAADHDDAAIGDRGRGQIDARHVGVVDPVD